MLLSVLVFQSAMVHGRGEGLSAGCFLDYLRLLFFFFLHEKRKAREKKEKETDIKKTPHRHELSLLDFNPQTTRSFLPPSLPHTGEHSSQYPRVDLFFFVCFSFSY